jgi:hypothetical protein
MDFLKKGYTGSSKWGWGEFFKQLFEATYLFTYKYYSSDDRQTSPLKRTLGIPCLTWEHFRLLDCVWNTTAHAQKPDFVFRRNGRVHLNRQGPQFSQLLASEVCTSAVVMLDTPSSEVLWRVLATHSIRQFPLHFPSRVSPFAITFQLDSTTVCTCVHAFRPRLRLTSKSHNMVLHLIC